MSTANITCPFCGSSDTRKQSDFGTSVMVEQHYCRNCRTVFEWIKWGDDDTQLDVPEFLKGKNKPLSS